jgi:uncharacterized protein
VLSPDARQRIEARLTEREQATGAQMVIAIFPSLEGESLEDFSIRLAERWRIGDKKLDNGVILLVFVQDRRLRMEVGYGLEAVLPDAVAAQIISNQIGPRFREGRWGDGLMAGVDAVFARIDTRGASAPPQRHAFGMSPWVLGLLVIFGLAALMLAREAGSGGRRNAYSAGGRRGWGSPPIFLPPMGGSGGSGWGGGGGDSGGGFSGGGGGFGGGGASGQW